jgi:sugar lactone lactonase YvrE
LLAGCEVNESRQFHVFPAMSFVRILFVAGLLVVAARAEQPAAAQAMMLARDATKAAEEKDNATYLAKMEQAVALRPDFPRMLVNLAAAQVANEKPDEAIATLEKLAALGLSSPIEKNDDFAPLKPRKDYQAVLKKIAGNMQTKGAGEIAFTLRDVTGLMEGIAWRETTNEFYFGDVNGRGVWVWKRSDDVKRDARGGTLRRLTPEGDELYGVFGLAIDEASNTLWAATSAVAAMRGFTYDMDGTAALAEIDLTSGAVRRVIPVVRRSGDQQSHVLGDLALAPDGSVFVTDSGGPTLWRLAPGGTRLEASVESDEFMSLQGIVVLPEKGAVILSDHANGFLRVDLRTRQVRRLESPADTTLIGCDGLCLAPNGDIIAIQNGLRPNRVLRVVLDESAESIVSVEVLESGHLQMAAPSLGCLGPNGDFYFIGNAGWTAFENTDAKPTAPRSVPIYRTKIALPPPKKK